MILLKNCLSFITFALLLSKNFYSNVNYFYPLLLLLFLSSCNFKATPEEEELYSYLQGTFTSENQSQQDSTYYNITLNLAHIWQETGKHWIYVEQAVSNALHNPYTQRIYLVTKDSIDRLIMKPYRLENPGEFIGGWREPSMFDSLSPKDLSPLSGCDLYFRKKEGLYVGETEGKKCKSFQTGSNYSINHCIVSKNKLISWGRGYDENEKQVWGKTEGGYIFDKTS